jgi:NADPH:quinone reductase-like Zn-dependent oxidoreductase
LHAYPPDAAAHVRTLVEDAPEPVPGPGDALAQVEAVGLTKDELTWRDDFNHPADTVRPPSVPGHELAGVLRTVPDTALGLSVGDPVWGLIAFDRAGGAAELVAVAAADLARRPAALSATAAAALALTGLTAWQALHTHAALQPGQHVLVLGAGGSVGSVALQVAKAAGARVTAVARSRHHDRLRQLGADAVIDTDSAAIDDGRRDVDVALDTAGPHTHLAAIRRLRVGGTLVSVTVPPDEHAQDQAREAGVRAMYFIVEPNGAQLDQLAGLVVAGHLSAPETHLVALEDAAGVFDDAGYAPSGIKTVLVLG